MRKVITVSVLVAAAAGLIYHSRISEESSADSSGARLMTASPVTTYTLSEQAFQSQVRALGTLRAWESVDITSSVSETVVKLHFESGQTVNEGQLLVTLKQEEEQASLREQQEILKEQEREVRRLVDLVKKNQVAQTELDQRRTLAAIARNKIEQMNARIEDRNIHAPFSGVLGLRQVSPGALVAPGEPITTLDDISRMRLEFTVPALSLGFLSVGQQVEATSAAFVNSFNGTLLAVDTRVDPVSRSLTARAAIDNPDGRLKPGLLMSVILVGPPRQSLLVPEEALVVSGNKQYVWLLQGNEAIRTAIEIGERRPGWVEVTLGLQSGEEVVRDGVVRLRGERAPIERIGS